MPLSRRKLLAMAAAASTSPFAALAHDDHSLDEESLLASYFGLLQGRGDRFDKAVGFFANHGTLDMAPGIILTLRFGAASEKTYSKLLQKITGEKDLSTWFEWMLWQEAHPEITPHESYIDLKRMIFLGIDPNFDQFLRKDYLTLDRLRIRVEEITWGGVRKDGIPSLDNPTLINADDADYLLSDDLVFGVKINGDARAYPLRIMGWHEMFNDVIGGVNVALAYCTLCGSGILFETGKDGQSPYVFGSSGFLYRSNKLMFDRETHSLWNQFTGKPVTGPLVGQGIELTQRPVVVDTWENWKSVNPDTRVLDLDTGFLRDYGSGVVYKDYFASPDLMFPTAVDQSQHLQKDYVFGIRTFGAAKAWPLDAFADKPVINDRIADTDLVLIGDRAGRSVRAFESGGRLFSLTDGKLQSDDGQVWALGEEELRSESGQTLQRVAGHIAYWFAWDGYMGDVAELYEG